MDLWVKIMICVVAVSLGFGIFATYYIAHVVFKRIFVRTSPDLWTRANSEPGNNEDHDRMHELAEQWNAEHRQYIKEVSIVNEELKLTGQYFDFGFSKCAIILSGRTEGCVYSSGFSEPYVKSGYNILVPDSRGHGNSDGKIITMGYREQYDLLKWISFAHDVLNNEKIVLRGVCVGAATDVYAMSLPQAPEYVTCIVVEGLYETFYEVLRRRIITRGHKAFPVQQWLRIICRERCGVDYKYFTPGSRIGSIKKPMLFLQSREDVSTLPETAEKMFSLCGSEQKKIHWFEHGSHSHVRLNNQKEYDETICSFLREMDSGSGIF